MISACVREICTELANVCGSRVGKLVVTGRAVHRHLNDQLAFLSSRDGELYALIASIKSEELSHLHQAEKNVTSRGPITRMLRRSINTVTEDRTSMSTACDSGRMARQW